ncbi:MGH1-like glycoside hydrolase domain-containing protein [Tunicatimonas pelagia]|uniref:MGH1-like glycoside hydrolase domain-containing protein n=1 Tax=Tunicatimonas pelagia TaxID=931531 RepID=UPI0026655A46|nr:glucosidase [Tunicatimonas pelagia]WKN43936.1 glucosidase [Tunicatimonas pelagia]
MASTQQNSSNPELERVKQLTERNEGWKRFGPYLSERQWGTVREDYSDHGNAWGHISHDMSRSYAYRWGEDGIAGFSDNKQMICLGLALWNEKDPILKERLFGLSNPEGNHGEDVKELYYYLDGTPSHSYMKMLYKYPQQEFPYQKIVSENRKRNKQQLEYELIDTGVFNNDEYFDVYVEYAKAKENDIIMKVTVWNRSKQAAPIHILPTCWFRNTWSWGYDDYKPNLQKSTEDSIKVTFRKQPDYFIRYEGEPELLFCENETNGSRFSQEAITPFPKDAIHRYVVNGENSAVNPEQTGTKAALHYQQEIPAGESWSVKIRFSSRPSRAKNWDKVVEQRQQEADLFYEYLQQNIQDEDQRRIQRQGYAGMLWSKQFYYYDVDKWIKGDPNAPELPAERKSGRNASWRHLVNQNIISMPDKWEYPWYAAWDLAFHCVPLARLDPEFAKRQLLLMLREYYMHPNGQIPAYEWNFSDVNPPVHAWGAWQVYTIDKETRGEGDVEFLAKVFHKLLMNFTWWVNQKDSGGNNLFEGGFLGLDNIGVFDRSHNVPNGGYLEQADATAWMAMYSLNMLRMALEIAQTRPYYQEMASKFFEHFLAIASSMFNIGKENVDLWDDVDEFYYDVVHPPEQPGHLLKVRSIVGIIPLFAVEVLNPELYKNLPDFTRRLQWVLKNRPEQGALISRWYEPGRGETRMLSLVRVHRLKCILRRMLSEQEFLSDYGIRAMSKYHENNPYEYQAGDHTYSVSYLPGESDSGMFGGNSNWRGPIWFPINFMIIESLQKFHQYYGNALKVEFPTGSGKFFTLDHIAQKISERLTSIFTEQADGKRAFTGDNPTFQNTHFHNNLLFYEYFHGESGRGLGASHQTGWTGLVSELIQLSHQ